MLVDETYLASGGVCLFNRLDDTDSDGLTHVANGETAERRVFGESLDTHGLGWHHLDNGGITRLDELGRVLNRLAGTAVNLLEELRELAGNVRSVAVKNWGVTGANLTRVVENNDLGVEALTDSRGVVLGVTSNVTTADVLDRHVLDIEANVVTGQALSKLLVVHLDRLDFSGHIRRGKSNNHAGLEDTSLDTADRYRANATNLVDILKGKTKSLISGTRWGLDGVNSLEEGLAVGLGTTLVLLLPSLVPGAVGRGLKHVVAVEARDGDKGNGLGVVANLLDEVAGLLDDFLVPLL